MSRPLSYVLLADGNSDRCLLEILRWALRDTWSSGEFAAPKFFPRKHRKIPQVVDEIAKQYRPDLLFVHRDAERESPEQRHTEIPHSAEIVPVVPVRMTEAWLLIDEGALRRAADNPNGKTPLQMPSFGKLEDIDAKTTLHQLLRNASGKTGRRLKRFRVERAVYRLAELIEDYSPLKRLPAFCAFRKRLEETLQPFRNAPY